MQDVIQEQQIRIAILAVPAGAVQAAADSVVTAGVRGIVNFAPVPLHVSPDVFVENMDITATLEKVAFFAQAHRNQSTLAGKSA
jgi:redox-sensing transcriptional repressor